MLLVTQPWHEFWIEAAARLQSQKPEDGAEYSLFTLSGDEFGRIWRSSDSIFVGFTQTTPHFELREPSIIKANVAIDLFQKLGHPALIINKAADLILFFLVGGHGIIKRQLLMEWFPDWLEPSVGAPLGSKPGFAAASSVPRSKFVKRPRKKVKLRVHHRDGNKCLLCGNGSGDGISLTLHHITMRKYGGFTEEDNLATVCRGCHDGIGELVRYDFYEMIGIDRYDVSSANREYLEGVKRYREIMRRQAAPRAAEATSVEPGTPADRARD